MDGHLSVTKLFCPSISERSEIWFDNKKSEFCTSTGNENNFTHSFTQFRGIYFLVLARSGEWVSSWTIRARTDIRVHSTQCKIWVPPSTPRFSSWDNYGKLCIIHPIDCQVREPHSLSSKPFITSRPWLHSGEGKLQNWSTRYRILSRDYLRGS